jgi:hypothetical protein
MATAKRQAPKPVAAAVPKKLTRKEKSRRNKEAYRKAQQEEFAKLKRQGIIRTATGKALVVRGDKPKPVDYDPVIARRICLMFAADPNMSLLVLNNDPTLPTVWTFYEWLIDHPDFSKLYSRARELNCDLKAADIERMSTEPLIGEVVTKRTGTGFKGNPIDSEETKTYDNVDRARLAVETRKWILSKERPRKYGVQPIELDDNSGLQDLLAQFRARSLEIEGR